MSDQPTAIANDRTLNLLLALSILRERAKKAGRDEEVRLIDEAAGAEQQK